MKVFFSSLTSLSHSTFRRRGKFCIIAVFALCLAGAVSAALIMTKTREANADIAPQSADAFSELEEGFVTVSLVGDAAPEGDTGAERLIANALMADAAALLKSQSTPSLAVATQDANSVMGAQWRKQNPINTENRLSLQNLPKAASTENTNIQAAVQTVAQSSVQTSVQTEAAAAGALENALDVNEGVVAPGDTASKILSEYLDPKDIDCFAQACKAVFPLTGLQAGRPYVIAKANDAFRKFEYQINRDQKLIVVKRDNGFQADKITLDYDIKVAQVEGEITHSLFGAVTSQGETSELAVRLADVFAWEVDFIRDIRQGDRFKVLVEKKYRNGKVVGYGKLLAAEFINQGDTYEGYLFEDTDGRPGYYTAEGKNLRKAFLKAPLKFSRISSGFSMSRLHPILRIRRPHPGIDYAAPTGTPVKAVANATVTYVGWNKGGGRTVKLRHNGGYETTYMHLSRYAHGLKKGKKITQGDVIAYVGSTGLSTGPHLDFRVKKNGSYINPKKIKNTRSEPLTKAQMAEFRGLSKTLHAKLNMPKERPFEAEYAANAPHMLQNDSLL